MKKVRGRRERLERDVEGLLTLDLLVEVSAISPKQRPPTRFRRLVGDEILNPTEIASLRTTFVTRSHYRGRTFPPLSHLSKQI